MRRNGYLWTSGVNLDTAVRFTDSDFLLECKISVTWRRFPLIFAFYMLNIRHISTSTPTSIIPIRFEVDMTINCRVIAFLSADTSRDLVTLTIDLLTLNRCHTWGVTWPTSPLSMKTLCISVLQLWVITFPVGYHWKCVRGHCACAESCDPWVGGQKQLHFWDAWLRFTYSLCNFGGSTMKVIKVICENNARSCVKRRMSFCACAKSRDLLKVP